MRHLTIPRVLLGIAGLVMIAGFVYWLPPVHSRLSWRLDFALTYLRGLVQPMDSAPTPAGAPAGRSAVEQTSSPKESPTLTPEAIATPTPIYTPTTTPTPTPIPGQVILPAPKYEKQDINNCGPASLTMYLRFYGWEG
ncbi:MAG: hypothetical protein JXB15_06385, partial [Anaerolineales bacterium]|nr:hypothetical protein [Anaerolineales bacterium]